MSHDDLDQLLSALIPFAQEQLDKHGEFFPFGGVMKPDGEMGLVARGDDGPDESDDMRNQLMLGLRHEVSDGKARAAAVCADMTFRYEGEEATDARDAIGVHLECPGEAVMVYLPYSKAEDGSYEYGDLVGSAQPAVIFPES